MDFRFLLCLCLMLGGNLGCRHDYISVDDETYEEELENQPEQPQPPEVEKPSNDDASTHQQPETGFDPCPEVTYVLWDENGVKYEVTITVFCDPSPVFNLGCPGPEI